MCDHDEIKGNRMQTYDPKNVVYEDGLAEVYREDDCYCVNWYGRHHSGFDSAYTLDEDGLSLAKARCDYLAKHRKVY